MKKYIFIYPKSNLQLMIKQHDNKNKQTNVYFYKQDVL